MLINSKNRASLLLVCGPTASNPVLKLYFQLYNKLSKFLGLYQPSHLRDYNIPSCGFSVFIVKEADNSTAKITWLTYLLDTPEQLHI